MGEIVEGLLAAGLLADQRVGVEPHQLADGIIVLAQLVVAPRDRRPARDDRIIGRVLNRTPLVADVVVVGRGRHRERVERFLLRPQASARSEHIAPILRLSFVHPEQRITHRHVEVRRPQIGRTAEFAVPGVRVLVREEIAPRAICSQCTK